jgi:hypothetical protein
MDGKTKANGLYTAKNNIIASDEDNAKNFNEGLNDVFEGQLLHYARS